MAGYFKLIAKNLPTIVSFAIRIIIGRIQAKIHLFTYKLLVDAKNVIVIGGSYGGLHLARRLAESLPSGYKVILVERNSHFNYTFNFPRYSVVKGRERLAFIPYDGATNGLPKGALEMMKGTVVAFNEKEIELASGEVIPYAYLAIATGITSPTPAKLVSTEKSEACAELRALQTRISESQSIAIVGAGAVGIQIACDIKTFNPEKNVTVIHSRGQLMSNFGPSLHEHVLKKLEEFGISVILRERPNLPDGVNWEPTELKFKNGKKESFDLVIPCTGQIPNSSLLSTFSPSSISPENSRILVKPTLQLSTGGKSAAGSKFDHIFALGDVADHGGPHFARAAMMQAEIVRDNIIASVTGRKLTDYKPIAMEGSLKLGLGKDEQVIYAQEYDGSEFIIPAKSNNIDLEVKTAWWMQGAKFEDIVVEK